MMVCCDAPVSYVTLQCTCTCIWSPTDKSGTVPCRQLWTIARPYCSRRMHYVCSVTEDISSTSIPCFVGSWSVIALAVKFVNMLYTPSQMRWIITWDSLILFVIVICCGRNTKELLPWQPRPNAGGAVEAWQSIDPWWLRVYGESFGKVPDEELPHVTFLFYSLSVLCYYCLWLQENQSFFCKNLKIVLESQHSSHSTFILRFTWSGLTSGINGIVLWQLTQSVFYFRPTSFIVSDGDAVFFTVIHLMSSCSFLTLSNGCQGTEPVKILLHKNL